MALTQIPPSAEFLLCWSRYTPCRALGDDNEKTI